MPSLIRLDNGQIFKLKNENAIGRGVDAQIFLDDDGISRHHAQVNAMPDGSYEIRDMGSCNGMYLNSRLAKNAYLMAGDQVGIGNVTLVFTEDDKAISPTETSGRSSSSQRHFKPNKTLVMMQDSNLDFVEYASTEPVLNAVSKELEGEWLRKLFMATVEINSASNEMDVYEAVNQTFQDSFSCSQIYLALFDSDRGLNMALATGDNDTKRMSTDIMRRALVDAHSILVKNPATSGLSDKDTLIRAGVSSVISAPLLDSTDKPFGIIYLDSVDGSIFQNDEFGFTRAVCYQAGLHLSSILQQPKGLNETQHIKMMLPGKSQYINELNHTIEVLAKLDSPILICGQNGNDFELISKAVHNNGPRGDIRLMTLNCADFGEKDPEEVIFGSEKKGLLGKIRQAHRGSLVIENLDQLDLALQQKIFNYIASGTVESSPNESVDTRLIFTVSEPYVQVKATGKLHGMLSTVLEAGLLNLIPLQNHREDIEDIIYFYFQHVKTQTGKANLELSKEALHKLAQLECKGNELEIKFILRIAALRCPGNTLNPENLEDFT